MPHTPDMDTQVSLNFGGGAGRHSGDVPSECRLEEGRGGAGGSERPTDPASGPVCPGAQPKVRGLDEGSGRSQPQIWEGQHVIRIVQHSAG